MMFNRFLYSLILNFKSYFFKSSAIFILFYFTLTVIVLLAIGNIKSNYLDFSSIGLETDYDLTGELLIVFLLVYGSVSYYRVAFMSQAHQKFYKTDLSYLTAAPDRKSGFLVFKLLQTFPKLCLVPVLTGLGIYIGITAMILCYMISIFLILYWLSNIIPKNVIKWSGPFTLFEKLLDKPTIVFLRLFIGFLFELLGLSILVFWFLFIDSTVESLAISFIIIRIMSSAFISYGQNMTLYFWIILSGQNFQIEDEEFQNQE